MSYPCNIWLRSNEATESSHGFWSVQHPFIHVYIQDLSSHLHLGLSDAQSLLDITQKTQLRIKNLTIIIII